MIQKLVEENIELTREDGSTFTFKPVKNNHSGRLLYVTIRREKDPVTGNRLVEKSSSAGQVHCDYNATRNESTISFDYLPEDTGDLAEDKYVYDIESINPTNANDKVTPKSGYVKLRGDVRNARNNTNLPTNGIRYIPLPETIENGKVPRKKNSDPTLWESIDVYTKQELDPYLARVHDHLTHLHVLSQIDIDNKYIDANYLSSVTDLSSVIVVVENASAKLTYLLDYLIADNKINWSGLAAEEYLEANDQLRIYYEQK